MVTNITLFFEKYEIYKFLILIFKPLACRYMLGLSAVPAALQFFGFLFLPESPRWLLQKGDTQKARLVLDQIRAGVNVDEEYESIRSNIEEERNDAGGEMMSYCLTFTYALSQCRFYFYEFVD